jgi:hypothetical protein
VASVGQQLGRDQGKCGELSYQSLHRLDTFGVPHDWITFSPVSVQAFKSLRNLAAVLFVLQQVVVNSG